MIASRLRHKACRRLRPDSIAARIAVTLVLALLVTQAISVLLYLADRGSGQPVHHLPVLIDRVVSIVQLVETTTPDARARTVRATDDPFLGVVWQTHAPEAAGRAGGGRLLMAAHAIAMSSGNPLRPVRIEVMPVEDTPAGAGAPEVPPPAGAGSPDMAPPAGAGAPDADSSAGEDAAGDQRSDTSGSGGRSADAAPAGSGRSGSGAVPADGAPRDRRHEGGSWGFHAGANGGPPHRLRITVGLVDGTWLVFTTAPPPLGPFHLLHFAAWIGLTAIVVVLLSLTAARRLAAPLARFADAAERLGVDADAPPLPEDGPAELRAATAAVNRMQARLSRFIDDRTRMLAAMSHDLRTPLTRLRLRAEFIEDGEIQRKVLADIDEMTAMIAATLAFARDDAEREARTALDLADLLQSLCEDRADTGATAAYWGPARLPCNGRPVALRRAFANLIDNAIKYGGCARVAMAGAGVGGRITVTIEDDGPGIPEPEREKVFAPFYRLEGSRSRDTGGTGLGLSVARDIVRRHGGEIGLANRPAGGLVVTVTLPG